MVLQDLKTDDLTRKSPEEFNNLFKNLRQFIFRKKKRKKKLFCARCSQEFFHHREMEKVFPCHFSGSRSRFFWVIFRYAPSMLAHPHPSTSRRLSTLNERELIFSWHFGIHAATVEKFLGKKNVFSKTWAPCVQAEKTFRHSPTTRNWLNFADKPKKKLFTTRWESAMRSALAD